jgi:hypothetical protein
MIIKHICLNLSRVLFVPVDTDRGTRASRIKCTKIGDVIVAGDLQRLNIGRAYNDEANRRRARV